MYMYMFMCMNSLFEHFIPLIEINKWVEISYWSCRLLFQCFFRNWILISTNNQYTSLRHTVYMFSVCTCTLNSIKVLTNNLNNRRSVHQFFFLKSTKKEKKLSNYLIITAYLQHTVAVIWSIEWTREKNDHLG